VTRRIVLRATVLAAALVGLVVGLTAYFSSEAVPPCVVTGIAKWRPPNGNHRFAVTFPNDGAACFVAIDAKQNVVAELPLPGATGITTAAPNGSDLVIRAEAGPYSIDLGTGHVSRGGLAPFDTGFVTATDPEHHVMYVTEPGLFGFRVIDLRTGATLYVVHYKGFTWNPRFGPNPPSHGLVLAPDRPELWVLDAPNHALHVFDVSELPNQPPRPVTDVRLDRTMTQSGSLLESSGGRYIYVAGAGAVIDTRTRTAVAQVDALERARAVVEVDWVDGHPVYPGFPR
jgi:hypothetical protein